MFIVTTRNKFLPAGAHGAVVVHKYRRPCKGQPCLNASVHMRGTEAARFERMQAAGQVLARDNDAAVVVEYAITND